MLYPRDISSIEYFCSYMPSSGLQCTLCKLDCSYTKQLHATSVGNLPTKKSWPSKHKYKTRTILCLVQIFFLLLLFEPLNSSTIELIVSCLFFNSSLIYLEGEGSAVWQCFNISNKEVYLNKMLNKLPSLEWKCVCSCAFRKHTLKGRISTSLSNSLSTWSLSYFQDGQMSHNP